MVSECSKHVAKGKGKIPRCLTESIVMQHLSISTYHINDIP